jgi:hypothetical protein
VVIRMARILWQLCVICRCVCWLLQVLRMVRQVDSAFTRHGLPKFYKVNILRMLQLTESSIALFLCITILQATSIYGRTKAAMLMLLLLQLCYNRLL